MPRSLVAFNTWQIPLPMAILFGVAFLNAPEGIDHFSIVSLYVLLGVFLLANAIFIHISYGAKMSTGKQIGYCIAGAVLGAVMFLLILALLLLGGLFIAFKSGGKMGG